MDKGLPDVRDVQVIEKKEVFRGFYKLDEYVLRVPKFDGTLTGPLSREVADRGDAAGVFLYDAVADTAVFVEQFRPGAFFAGENPWLLECVAGIVEQGETPQDVVIREAMEESGCAVKELMPMGRYFSSPGGMTERLTMFCGRVDSKKHARFAGLESEGEDIRVRLVSGDDVVRMANGMEISNGMTLIACQWFALNRAMLKEKWGTK